MKHVSTVGDIQLRGQMIRRTR